MVHSNQQAYYDAITASNSVGESTPFIEFMLGEILEALTRGEATKHVARPNLLFYPLQLSYEFLIRMQNYKIFSMPGKKRVKRGRFKMRKFDTTC